jgi:ketosteroid isomerase-like protein
MSAAQVLQSYFTETMGGDLSAVDRYFADQPDYVLVAKRNHALTEVLPWTGRQTDRAGIKAAYGKLLAEFEVLDATQDAVIEAGEHVAVFGTFRYRARSTGRVVDSAWAVHAAVRDGAIVSYRFHEDSHAVAAAVAPRGLGFVP